MGSCRPHHQEDDLESRLEKKVESPRETMWVRLEWRRRDARDLILVIVVTVL